MKTSLENQKSFSNLIFAGAVVIALIAVGVKIYIHSHEVVVLSGPSMSPTINSAQRVKVHSYAKEQTPQRGDIVEYTSTNSLVKTYAHSGKLIHRVVGLPGDKIVISNNKVIVYNSQNPKGFNPDSTYISSFVKTYPDMTVTIPRNSYFMLGDNRPYALDSRTIGPIPLKDIIGKVSL